tara:strand:+ start:29878 stop:30501 length:624 start_codon:yes stop_codon:yes gene_type:complete
MIKAEEKEKEKYKLFHYAEEQQKTQIILCHTSRPISNYMAGLKNRMDGQYKRIPNYVISRRGKVIKNFQDLHHSDFFGDETIDNHSIIVMLENLGWLKLNPLNNEYTNWIGDIYRGKVYQKKWRDKNFWATYTDKQIESLADLVTHLCEELGIEKVLVGHNVKVDGIKKFNGVCSRSNYTDYWTDLSPAFEFDKLKEHLNQDEKEQT